MNQILLRVKKVTFTMLLFTLVIGSPAQAQENSVQYTDEEVYQMIETLEASSGESQFPGITAPADVAALPEEDRELLLVDLQDLQRNADRDAALAGFTAPAECFDYYTFGSVDAPLSVPGQNVVSGTTGEFTVNLTNQNPYPVVDANVYVKLFRERAAGEQSAQLAHLVDQFQAVQGVSIPAQETVTRTFTYDVPASLPSGEYQMVSFVSTAQRYNLLGLPFTDDVVGDSTMVTVTGDTEGMVRWERDQVLVDQSQHFFASFIPEVSATEPVRVSAPIHNELNRSIDGTLTWSVYHWDQQNEANLIDTQSRPISIAPGDTIPATFMMENTDHAVYVVVGEVSHGDATSIINVRFARTDIPEVRLNYPGLLSYPLVAGEENTVFSCLHSASSFDVVPDTRLDLNITDSNGNEIFSHTYEGPVSAKMMGVAETFVPDRTYDTFTLQAELYQGDVLVEDVSFTYQCSALGAEPCEPAQADEPPSLLQALQLGSGGGLWLALGLLALLGLGGGLWYHRANRRSTDPSVPLRMLVGAILAFSALVPATTDASPANSKPAQSGFGTSITASDTYDTYDQSLSRRRNTNVFDRVENALQSPHATVHYHAEVFNETQGQMVAPGDTVNVGDTLQFTPVLGDISWFGTGRYSDSPLGVWYANAAFPQGVLSNFVLEDADDEMYESDLFPQFRVNSSVSIPFSVHPPDTNLTVTGSAPLNPLGSNRYTVTGGGTIEATYTFDPTYGYYYFGRISNQVEYPGIDPLRIQVPPYSDYAATFGERTLTLAFEARQEPLGTNEGPGDPSIDGPLSGVPATSYDFTLTGSDPDGDAVFYEVDWTGDGNSDYESPSVSSGDPVTVSRTWSTLGDKTFYARTADEFGLRSGWVGHTINITDPLNLSVALEVQDKDGNWTTSDVQLPPAASDITIRWQSTDADDCSATGFTMTGATPTDRLSGTQTVTAPSPGDDVQLTVTCNDGGGPPPTPPAEDTLNVSVTTYELPEVTVSMAVNAGPFTTADREIMPGDGLGLRWTSTNADACTGTHIPPGSPDLGQVGVSSPPEGGFINYTVTCTNPGGGSASDTIRVDTLNAPTLTLESSINGDVPNENNPRGVSNSDAIALHWTSDYADECTGTGFSTGGALQSAPAGETVTTNFSGTSITYSITCSNVVGTISDSVTFNAAQPDLVPINLQYLPSTMDDPTFFSTTTGMYDYVRVTFAAANQGDVATPAQDPQYSIVFDKGANGITDLDFVYDLGGNIAVGDSLGAQRIINDVPFGTSTVTIHLNPNDVISEKDLTNNIATFNSLIPPADPGLSLEIEDEIVRAGTATRLVWDVGATYPMDCSIQVDGVLVEFDPSIVGATGDADTEELNATRLYVLQCTEPITMTTFSDTARVEVIGSPLEV